MENAPDPLVTAVPEEASFVRGGPFYRAQQAVGLLRANQWNLGRRLALLIAVGWIPLLVITAILNPTAIVSFLKDYRIHARMLIAVPVLLFGELLMESRFRAVLAHIRNVGLLDAPEMAAMDKVIVTLVRVRDSFLPELGVLALLVIHTIASWRGLVDSTAWLASGTGASFHLSAAGWYAVAVSAPIFQFLLGLALLKWLLWTIFAFKLSRQPLKLIATHPDEHGGLGFLGITTSAFAPVAFAATAVIGATWRHDILHGGAHLMTFKLPAIALAVIVALLALGPLVFFVPRVAALRRKGILEYGILAQLHSAEFHEKWIVHRAGHEAEFLQAPESSSLADFGQVYEKIQAVKAFPADTGSLYSLAAAILIPALPTVLAEIPLGVVLKDLLEALR
jgi:hypothetical protein